MESFFTGANLTRIIGIISSIAAGLSALSKYRYEKKLELFKETNVNISKKEKEEVLVAISTMSVFKRAVHLILYSGPILTFAECSQ